MKASKTMSKEKNKTTIEGEQALKILYEELDKEGLLVTETAKSLDERLSNLESEVRVLKDLFVRSLNFNLKSVLKD